MEYVILIVFLIIFYFLYKKDKKDSERFDNSIKTLENVIVSVFQATEKIENKFYAMSEKIVAEHFKQLTEITDNQSKVFSDNVDKLLKLLEDKEKRQEDLMVEKISRLDEGEANSIEKEEQLENPLEELNPANFRNIKNIQFEGEEEIYPIANE